MTGAARVVRAAALVAGLLCALAVVVPATSRAADVAWRLEQPAPPAGSLFKVPLGTPGDLQCLSADRCVLAVQGNDTVAQGLYFFDGASWRQLSTVCGGSGDTTRIAWASPDELWTITSPSLPRLGAGLALCRIRDGEVIGSYSTPDQSADPFQTMTAAACDGPDDCWFAGRGAQDPTGGRAGTFHLHWDGSTLSTSYAPQGRGASDIVARGDVFVETSLAGVQREDRQTAVSLAQPEDRARLVKGIDAGGSFTVDGFTPRDRAGVGAQGTELLAADVADGAAWLVGGGAASGPDAPSDRSTPRPPIALRAAQGTGTPSEVPIPDTAFSDDERFVDVAAIPGTSDALVAVQPYADRASLTATATVARIGADGSVRTTTLPDDGGPGRGAAAKVECTSSTDCWMVTTAGWLFHLSDGTALPPNADPAFARLIDFRPNESAAQLVPDAPPADDSQLFAPPPTPTPAEAQAAAAAPAAKALKALLFKITKPKVSRKLVLTLTFSSRRRARVQLQGRRKGKVVARTKLTTLKPGRHTLRMVLERRRYPTALRFRTVELDPDARGATSGDASTDDPSTTVTTGDGTDTGTATDTTTTAPASTTPTTSTPTTSTPGSDTPPASNEETLTTGVVFLHMPPEPRR